MSPRNAIVDVDSHVWERLDLIEEQLEPEYKDLAPRIQTDERGLEYMLVEGRKPLNILLGEGRFGRMWGADYPHSEGRTGAVESLKQSLSNLPEDARKKIMGENAVRLYGLS